MNCPHCSSETVAAASFCHACGVSLSDQEDVRIATSDSLLDTAEKTPAAIRDTRTDPRERLRPKSAPLEGDEQEIWNGGYARRATIPMAIGLGAVSLLILIGCLVLGTTLTGWGIAAAVVTVCWIGLLLRLVYLQLSVHYYLTNERLIHEHGLFHRVTHRIDVITIDDVTYEQRLIQRPLGVGKIRVTSGERLDPEIVMIGIENVKEVADLIDNARRNERERRGLHIETV